MPYLSAAFVCVWAQPVPPTAACYSWCVWQVPTSPQLVAVAACPAGHLEVCILAITLDAPSRDQVSARQEVSTHCLRVWAALALPAPSSIRSADADARLLCARGAVLLWVQLYANLHVLRPIKGCGRLGGSEQGCELSAGGPKVVGPQGLGHSSLVWLAKQPSRSVSTVLVGRCGRCGHFCGQPQAAVAMACGHSCGGVMGCACRFLAAALCAFIAGRLPAQAAGAPASTVPTLSRCVALFSGPVGVGPITCCCA